MGASDSKSLQGLGFLTALLDEEQGWLGGLLILNAASRPLEFHCTAPVKPSRAQQILYGTTLAPYLCGEQIGAALTKKSNVQPSVYFTDTLDMMAVRPLVDAPVVFVETAPAADSAGHKPNTASRSLRIDGPHASMTEPHAGTLVSFRVNELDMCIDKSFPGDESSACAVLESGLPIDLHEPFQRIHEALNETQLRKR